MKSGGNERVCGPHTSKATLSIKIETPIVEINGAKWDTFFLRSGRSATNSNRYPRIAPTSIATRMATKILASKTVTINKPTKAPIIKMPP